MHYLLDIHSGKELMYHPILGYSWVGYVIEQVCQLLNQRIQPYYYRTHDGSEMDLVLVKGLVPIACIEIKYALSPSVSRGMRESMNDLQCKNNYIIIPSNDVQYKVEMHLKVRGLKYFIEKELPKLIK